MALEEVLSFAILGLVCAVLLQVLQSGGGRGVEDLTHTGTTSSLGKQMMEGGWGVCGGTG